MAELCGVLGFLVGSFVVPLGSCFLSWPSNCIGVSSLDFVCGIYGSMARKVRSMLVYLRNVNGTLRLDLSSNDEAVAPVYCLLSS
jgi:hypothetical protein